MTRSFAGLLLALSTLPATAAEAPVPSADHERLGMLVGRWTTLGDEKTFVETCDWFHGRFQVVCHSERTREDGSKGYGMSILGFVPDSGYVYTGIGSRGRFEMLQGGTWSEGVITYTSTAREGDQEVVTRIRVGPSTERGMPFVVDTSTAGGAWTAVESITYVRLP